MTRLLAGTALSLLLAFTSDVALAQAASTAPAPIETADARDSDIIVTAQRREQRLQDVGIAISVLSGEELARRGVTNVNQLQFQTPSLEVVPAFGGGQPQFRLRGVGFEDYATNNTPTVGVYVDQVAYPIPAMTQGTMFDIERVEVLRGPQGTLYGRNTTGGAINFVSRRPSDKFGVGGKVEYGRFGLLDAEGYVTGPISDTLKFRVSGVTEQNGGFQRNRDTGQKLGDADKLFGRALLEWSPTADSRVTLNVHGGRDKSEATGLRLFQDFQTSGYGVGVPGPVIPADNSQRSTGWGFRDDFLALTPFGSGSKPHRDNDSYGASLTADIPLGSAIKLTSISAYDKLKRRELNDWDASSSNESDTYWGSDIDVYSQELRLSSVGNGPFTWTAGAYYSRQTLDETFLTDFRSSLGFITDTSYRQKVDSISGFGQAEYNFTDTFKVIGGLRYEHEDRKLRDFATAIGGVPLFGDGNRDTDLDEVTGKVGVEYHPTTNILLYANASRGVKSGGFTVYNSPQSDQINAFKPEVLYAYEVGAKTDISREVRLNAAAFYYDYRNQQVLGTILNPQNGLIGRITNAPKSKIYGGEVEVVLTPTPRFQISQSVGFKRGKYIRFNDIDPTTLTQDPVTLIYSVGTIDRAGQDIPFANWSYQGSASYSLPLGDYALEGQVDYSYRDVLPSFLGTTYNLPDRWIANATLTFRPENGKWSVGAYGRNIFGEKYDLTRNFFLPNAKIASPGRPATYGVRVSFDY